MGKPHKRTRSIRPISMSVASSGKIVTSVRERSHRYLLLLCFGVPVVHTEYKNRHTYTDLNSIVR